jgi:hypothetical protein
MTENKNGAATELLNGIMQDRGVKLASRALEVSILDQDHLGVLIPQIAVFSWIKIKRGFQLTASGLLVSSFLGRQEVHSSHQTSDRYYKKHPQHQAF